MRHPAAQLIPWPVRMNFLGRDVKRRGYFLPSISMTYRRLRRALGRSRPSRRSYRGGCWLCEVAEEGSEAAERATADRPNAADRHRYGAADLGVSPLHRVELQPDEASFAVG
jgi:hypothetical protein